MNTTRSNTADKSDINNVLATNKLTRLPIDLDHLEIELMNVKNVLLIRHILDRRVSSSVVILRGRPFGKNLNLGKSIIYAGDLS